MHRLLTEPKPGTFKSEEKFSQGPISALARVSVVVPVGPEDDSWCTLLESFAYLPDEAEVWLIATEAEPADFSYLTDKLGIGCQIGWSCTTAGRAHQMNTGTRLCQREFLWFLHADSQFTSDALDALSTALTTAPDSIHFFDLRFQPDGPAAACLNAWGVWLRSHCLRLPFGDQGLCMRRATLVRLGGFPENVLFGEDHLLVWQAHRQRVPLRAVRATLSTSARKYRSHGWLNTTVLHVWRTWTQAIPEFVAFLWSRIR